MDDSETRCRYVMPPRESTEAVETASLHWVGDLRSRCRVAVVAGTWRSSASVRRTLPCAFDMLSNLDMVSYRGEGWERGLAPVLVRGTGALMPMPGAILDRVAGSSSAGSIVSQCPPARAGWRWRDAAVMRGELPDQRRRLL
jgi:hypothetical protein